MPITTSFCQEGVEPAAQVPWRRLVVISGGDALLDNYYWRVPVWHEGNVRAAVGCLPATGTMVIASDWSMERLVRAEEDAWRRAEHVGSVLFHGQYDFDARTAAQLMAKIRDDGATVHVLTKTYFDSFKTAEKAWTTAMTNLAGFTGPPINFDDAASHSILTDGMASTRFDEVVVVKHSTSGWGYLTAALTAYALKG